MCNMNVHVNVIKRKTTRSTRMGQIGKCVRRNCHKWNRFCSACCSSGFLRKKISVRMLLDHPVERAMHQTLPAQNVEPNKQRDPIFGWDLWVVMRISIRMIKTHSWTDQPTIPEVVSGKNDHKWNGRTFFFKEGKSSGKLPSHLSLDLRKDCTGTPYMRVIGPAVVSHTEGLRSQYQSGAWGFSIVPRSSKLFCKPNCRHLHHKHP